MYKLNLTLFRSQDFWSVTLLVLSLLGMNAFALQYIHLGHFWDEAWVYVPALKEMSLKGVSLFPHTISVELTRGHPLLFHFIGGWWYKLFGLSNEAGHSYALLLANVTLVIIYLGTRKVVGPLGAFFTVLFIIVQPIFLTQSAMVFPEMMVTLFAVLAAFAYHQQRVSLFVVALSCLLYTKESGLVYFMAFLIWDLFRIIFLKDTFKLLLKYTIPVLVIIAHPLILYWNFEWFLFPEHTSLILDDIEDVKWQLRRVFEQNFHVQGREWLFFPIMALMVLESRIRPFWVKLILIAAAFSAFKVLFIKWVVPDWAMILILLTACIAPPFVWLKLRVKEQTSQTTHLLAVGFLALVGYVIFSAINFFTIRYLLSSIVLTTILVSIGLWKSFIPVWAKTVVSVVLVCVPLYYTATLRDVGEVNLGLYDDLQAQQNAVDWIVDNVSQDAWICTNFVSAHYLLYPHAGYLSEEERYQLLHVNYCLTPCETEYVLRTRTVAECNINQDWEADGYEAVFVDTVGISSATVFRKKI